MSSQTRSEKLLTRIRAIARKFHHRDKPCHFNHVTARLMLDPLVVESETKNRQKIYKSKKECFDALEIYLDNIEEYPDFRKKELSSKANGYFKDISSASPLVLLNNHGRYYATVSNRRLRGF